MQKAGFFGPRTAAASHTRPFWSNIELWLLTLVSQSFSSPQYGDGAERLDRGRVAGPEAFGRVGIAHRRLEGR